MNLLVFVHCMQAKTKNLNISPFTVSALFSKLLVVVSLGIVVTSTYFHSSTVFLHAVTVQASLFNPFWYKPWVGCVSSPMLRAAPFSPVEQWHWNSGRSVADHGLGACQSC